VREVKTNVRMLPQFGPLEPLPADTVWMTAKRTETYSGRTTVAHKASALPREGESGAAHTSGFSPPSWAGSQPPGLKMKGFTYKRILLKLSGEALMGEKSYGIDSTTVHFMASEIRGIVAMGVEIAVVIGGGNIFRGVEASVKGMERASADYMGMLATVINALALQNSLEKIGVHTRVQSAIEMQELAEPYIRRRAMRHLEKGRVVIFAAGTGNPYFTTDTAAALRAMEIGAEIILKATKVDGVYTSDPMKDPTAKKYSFISYIDVLRKGLSVMDSTAISLCMDNNLPIMVFNVRAKGNIKKIVQGKRIGTLVGGNNAEGTQKKDR